jgi:AcrR family transcriptional regulator
MPGTPSPLHQLVLVMLKTNGKSPRRRGTARKHTALSKRRRNKKTHAAILAAAESLLNDRGYMNVTIEAIAAKAGAGKQTIYRWWPSKAAVYMELYSVLATRDIRLPDTGSIEQDLCELLDQLFKLFNQTAAGPALAGLVAEAQSNRELGRFLFDELVTSRRILYRQLLERGIKRGEVRRQVDIEMAIDILCGPVWYRLLLGHAPLHRRFAKDFVRELLNGFAVKPSLSADSRDDLSPVRAAPRTRSFRVAPPAAAAGRR